MTTDPKPDFTGPLAGIEVRRQCPYCTAGPQMIPRSLFDEHVMRLHPDVNTTTVSAPVDRIRQARRRLTSALLAVESHLTAPYPDAQSQTPWTRFVAPALKELTDAVDAAVPVPASVLAVCDAIEADYRDQHDDVAAGARAAILRVRAAAVPVPADQTDDRRARYEAGMRTIPGWSSGKVRIKDAALAAMTVADAEQRAGRAAVLSASERRFLTFALELAADQMAARSDEFDADDDAALTKLRRLADETQQAPTDADVVEAHELVVQVADMVCGECLAPIVLVTGGSGGSWNHTVPADDGHDIEPKPLLRARQETDEAQQAVPEAPAVVAYRADSGRLHCVDCLHSQDALTPLTAEDLPDGGVCTCCHTDVLAQRAGERR